MSEVLLRVTGLETAYGQSQVLFGLDLEIRAGEVVTLLGRNGMGKTTTVRSIMGLTPARGGSIEFRGQRIERQAPDRIARAGIALVPEGRHEVTTEGGLDVIAQESRVREVIARLHAGGVRTSIFIDAIPAQIAAAHRCGAAVCEVHTGPWAHAVHDHGDDCRSPAALAELDKVRLAGEMVQSLGMQFNAGHALNFLNVGPIAALPGLNELHIGHSIVSSAVFLGIRAAVQRMRSCIDIAAPAVH